MTGADAGGAGNPPTGGNIGTPDGAEVVGAGAGGTAGNDEKKVAGGTIVSHGDAAAVRPDGPPGLRGRHVVVIGGGLAGITAAIRLREAGAAVTVLEARPWLGGATCSFTRGEKVIDNGQHVFLRCCTEYQALLARLGMTGSVTMQERFDVTVLTPGRQARLRRNSLPAPLHLSGALARYGLLTPGERLKVGRAALGMKFANPARPELDDQRLGDWLGRRWQGERPAPALGPVHHLGPEYCRRRRQRRPGRHGHQDRAAGPQGRRRHRHVRHPARRPARASRDAAADPAGRRRAPVRQGRRHRARRARRGCRPGAPAPRRFRVPVTSAGDVDEVLSADAVVLAVPAAAALRLAPPALAAGAARWGELGVSPIVNVHVHYDRRVTRLPFAAALESPVQWVFDKTRAAGVTTGQYLAVSQSAADSYVDVPAARLREEFLPAMEQLFPAAAEARVLDFFVTRERRATFRQGPGTGRLRPGAGTAVPGLALAGAWTETGWPDTMEGAVRSGQNAAEHIMSGLAALGLAPRRPQDQARPGVIAAGASS